MDCSTPGFPVLHYVWELAQTHVHWLNDTLRPSHPLSLPSLPALSLSQHQGLFWWVSSSHQVAKILEFQLQHQSSQWIFRVDFCWDGWFDIIAVQANLKSLLQHHSLKVCLFLKVPKFLCIHPEVFLPAWTGFLPCWVTCNWEQRSSPRHGIRALGTSQGGTWRRLRASSTFPLILLQMGFGVSSASPLILT